jgi:hypothetical protein
MTSNFFSPLSFVAVFGSGIRDPRSGMGKNQDPGSGINIPDPQHWYFFQFLIIKTMDPDSEPDPDPYLDSDSINPDSQHWSVVIQSRTTIQVNVEVNLAFRHEYSERSIGN